MGKYIYIQADTNDGDYIGTLNNIAEEDLEVILPIIQKIADNFGEFATYEMGSSARDLYGDMDNYDLFREFTPYGEYGIHTITEIKILEVTEVKNLI